MPCIHHWIKRLLCVAVPALMLAGCAATTAPQQKAEVPEESEGALTEEQLQELHAQQDFDAALHVMKSGNHAKAKELFVAMTNTYPDYSGPWVNLGILNERKGELVEAEAAFKKATEVNKETPEVFNQLGVFYRNQGKFANARLAYERGLEHHPDYAPLHRNIGILYDLYMGQIDKALPHYQAYLKIMPGDKEVETWQADILQRLAR